MGDLNPEGVFIEASNYPLGTDLYRDRSDIGTWFMPSTHSDDPQAPIIERDWATRRIPDTRGPMSVDPAAWLQPSIMGRQSYRSEESSFLDRTRHTFIFQDCLNLLPPDEDFEQLRSLFLERIYPVLPVFNSADVAGDHPSKISRCVINQVIALAAATDPDASNYLRLERDGSLLSFQEFHQRLAHAIFAILDANMLISRVDHIRILTMMSFFYQPSSTSERDMPCLLFSQAVHYTQSLGIQLLGYRPERQDENIEQLFCALWAMDRMMAAFFGRPCLLHERDIDRDLDECIDKQPPCFRLFLRVVQLLDKVIDLYRPKKSRKAESIDLPVFEGMALDAGAEKSSPRILGQSTALILHLDRLVVQSYAFIVWVMLNEFIATIETFYHAVSVLSCRQPSSAFSPSASEQAHLPHPAINARRSLSADRIFMVVQSEEICSLPFIPYAVSVSLSVAYRKMRHSKVPMYRVRARTVFRDIVSLLKRLGEVYTTARVNAGLGESILREMEKTANSLTTPVDTVSNRTLPLAGQTRAQNVEESDQVANVNLVSGGGIFDGSAPGENGQIPLDPALLGNMDEIDLFGYFDRGFNLGAVDAALEANLDMGFPQNWTSPWYQSS